MANVWVAIEQYLKANGPTSVPTLASKCGAPVGASPQDVKEMILDMEKDGAIRQRSDGKYELASGGMQAAAKHQPYSTPGHEPHLCPNCLDSSKLRCPDCGHRLPGGVGTSPSGLIKCPDCGNQFPADMGKMQAADEEKPQLRETPKFAGGHVGPRASFVGGDSEVKRWWDSLPQSKRYKLIPSSISRGEERSGSFLWADLLPEEQAKARTLYEGDEGPYGRTYPGAGLQAAVERRINPKNPQPGRDYKVPATLWIVRWADGPAHITGEDGYGQVQSQIVMPHYVEYRTQAGAQKAARSLKEQGAHNIRVTSYQTQGPQAGDESPHGFAADAPTAIREAPKMTGAIPASWGECANCGKRDSNVDPKGKGGDLCYTCERRQNEGAKKLAAPNAPEKVKIRGTIDDETVWWAGPANGGWNYEEGAAKPYTPGSYEFNIAINSARHMETEFGKATNVVTVRT